MTPGQTYRIQLDWFVRVGVILVFCAGAAVMYGWIVDIPFLKSPVPGLATMKVNTACGFIAASAALWLVHICAPGSPWLRVARCLAGMVAGVGALTLVEDLFALDFGIDELILPDDPQPAATAHPGRMSPATSFSFFFFGLAVLALKARRVWIARCAHRLVVPSLVVAMLAILGYSYSVNSLQNIGPYTSMAVHTAVSFFALSLFVLAADLNHGFAKIATSDTAGGIVSRRLLPTIPITLFLLSLLRLKGEVDGYYNFQFGLALMVGMSISVSVIAVAWIATTLHATDVKRQAFQAEIISLNADLEMRVQRRTEELEQVSIKLSSANNALERLSLERDDFRPAHSGPL